MTHLRAHNIGLVYRLREKLTLRNLGGSRATGGVVSRDNGRTLITALNNFSFALEPGDRLAVTGPNGAGKTTLLKVLAGIYTPTSGHIDVSGRVDALFDISLGFRPEATGRRNILIRGLINGWSREQIEALTDGIIAFSELGEFIDMPVRTYSQGMQARLAFSISTAISPDILVMDEWIGAGDPSFQEKAAARMNDFAGKAGIIVLASHNHHLLRETCTKWLRLEHGASGALSTDLGELC